MCIINTNIFQPRILPKPELTQTLPKTNHKKIVSRSAQSITYCSCQLLMGVQGVSASQNPKKPDRREGFLGKKNAPPLRG